MSKKYISNMVSIIIPCYNVENYLQRSLNSIFANSYKEKQVILSNDGSTDNTLNILEKYVEEYSFFELIDKKNGGVASARNAGLEIARGEFIMFVDPDDEVMPNFISSAVNAIKDENGFDLVEFGFKLYPNEILNQPKETRILTEKAVLEDNLPKLFSFT